MIIGELIGKGIAAVLSCTIILKWNNKEYDIVFSEKKHETFFLSALLYIYRWVIGKMTIFFQK